MHHTVKNVLRTFPLASVPCYPFGRSKHTAVTAFPERKQLAHLRGELKFGFNEVGELLHLRHRPGVPGESVE